MGGVKTQKQASTLTKTYNEHMLGLISSFFSSFLVTLLILRYQHLHQHLSHDHDLSGPQKFHKNAVPRIGGLSILAGIFTVLILFWLTQNNVFTLLMIFFLCAIPTFTIGFTEDITKQVGVKLRLIFTAISAALITYLLAFKITQLDIRLVDYVFALPFVGFAFTVFAITGLANAYNIIDGFNGLAGMVAVITLIAIIYVCVKVSDFALVAIALVMIGSIIGFFIWNYPRGLIFLGDGGAYLIGFWIAALSILLVARHSDVSPWFALLINGYPVVETLFTIYRRIFHHNTSPGHPDGLHFHSLLYRRVVNPAYAKDEKESYMNNARTAPFLWVLSGLSAIPAVLWWGQTFILILFFIVFILIYILLYKTLVRFQVPRWLRNL